MAILIIRQVLLTLKLLTGASYDDWFSTISSLTTPLKFTQFQATQTILDVGQTTAKSRLLDHDEEELS